MSRLPVIVGFGGINAAGRISFHHAYRRLVADALGEADRALTYRSLSTLMNLQEDPDRPETRAYIDDHTLIRRIELFDPETIRWNREASLAAAGAPLEFVIAKRQLPSVLPDGWRVDEHDTRSVKVTVDGQPESTATRPARLQGLERRPGPPPVSTLLPCTPHAATRAACSSRSLRPLTRCVPPG